MPIKCYNKPSRKYRRIFTEKDAARVACCAFRDGATVQGFFQALELCAGEVLAEFVAKEVEKRIKPEFCKRFGELQEKVTGKFARVFSILRIVRIAVDAMDGLLSDIEDIRLAGLRVPRAFTLPLRRIVDSMIQLLDDIDEQVGLILNEFDFLRGYCDGETNNE